MGLVARVISKVTILITPIIKVVITLLTKSHTTKSHTSLIGPFKDPFKEPSI